VQVTRFDEEYLRRLRDGDAETQSHFSSHFGELLGLRLRHHTRSWDVLADVRQETFLRVLQAVRSGSIEYPERLGAFVLSVCDNVYRELTRIERRFDQDLSEPADARIEFERELISRDSLRTAERVLDRLPDKERNVLRMVFLEDLDKAEVCRRLGLKPEYLRVLLHRARLRFRERLNRTERETRGKLKQRETGVHTTGGGLNDSRGSSRAPGC
jgi:RNA polymerase sigma-70 factor (ECF subfamily)